MTKSESLFQQATAVIPGGVNSPVRAFNGVGGTPPFIERAEGAWMIDVDGNRYIDYVGSWGPMICGHTNPEIIAAVTETVTLDCKYRYLGTAEDFNFEGGEIEVLSHNITVGIRVAF